MEEQINPNLLGEFILLRDCGTNSISLDKIYFLKLQICNHYSYSLSPGDKIYPMSIAKLLSWNIFEGRRYEYFDMSKFPLKHL